jgi:hypothetical protein
VVLWYFKILYLRQLDPIIFCDNIYCENAFNILNYVEIWFEEVSWVSSMIMETSLRQDLLLLWLITNVFMICLKREQIAYDIKWCRSVWKHVYDDYGMDA